MKPATRTEKIGGSVFIHQRRRISEPGADFVIALQPRHGARWESHPIENEAEANTAAVVLATFAGAELRR
jgi:hypothetical protein